MSTFASQLAALLTGQTGNLVYQLVLVFAIAGALQAAIIDWRTTQTPQARRRAFGLGVLIAVQVLAFAVGSLHGRGILEPARILPPIDRAIALVSIVWITWLWAFPDPSPQADAGAVLLSLVASAGAALSLVTWPSRSATLQYNGILDDVLLQVASIGMIGLGAFMLIIRRTQGFANGLAFLGLAFLGHIMHLVVHEGGSYSGMLRLAYLAAFPLLLTLSQRLTAPSPISEGSTLVEGGPPAEPKRYGADRKTLEALIALVTASRTSERNRAITRAISHTMLADLCFLVLPTENKEELTLSSCYDLIREEYLAGTTLNTAAIPRLSNALQRGRSVRLPASGTAADIQGLGGVLGLTNPGNLLSAPFVTKEQDLLGGVVLLSPYSQRLWTAEDQNLLEVMAGSFVPLLQRGDQGVELERQAAETRQSLDSASEKIATLERHNREMSEELGSLRLGTDQEDSQRLHLQELTDARDNSERMVEALQQELATLRASGPSGNQMEQALNESLRDVAHLQNQLAESSERIRELEAGGGDERRKKEQAEIIASISQELRQPMSSIIGYTDLLLGESIGILGALQRKFIERIKAATERIGSLINDMIQLNTLEVGLTDLKPETMDLNGIIDNALAYTSSQVREKNISIHLDLPKSVAPVSADREALQQILIHLLQNAGAATPVEGKIALKVQTTKDNGQAFVMIQVTDSGGGIPEEDLPRVFTRLYRADNVLIQGVGDTGVGLSIAKTLTEAQRGRIWVESESGSGATFNVLLPMA
jgi:signal transduction histidine kinase